MFIKTGDGTIGKVYSDDDLRAKKQEDLIRELSEDVDLKEKNKKPKEN